MIVCFSRLKLAFCCFLRLPLTVTPFSLVLMARLALGETEGFWAEWMLFARNENVVGSWKVKKRPFSLMLYGFILTVWYYLCELHVLCHYMCLYVWIGLTRATIDLIMYVLFIFNISFYISYI